MEEGRVFDVSALKVGLDLIHPICEVLLVGTREGEDTTRVDTDTFDGELFSREVTTLDEESLVDVVWDARVELDLDLEPLIGEDLTTHVAAVDNAMSRQCAQVDVELERYLADVLDKEVTGLALVVGNLTEVNRVRRQLV